MDAKAAIRSNFNLTDMVFKAYFGDMTDAELLKRPTKGCNHIAFQVGHVIASEIQLLSGIADATATLPEGFAETHDKENHGCDDPTKFLTVAGYIALYDSIRQQSLAALESMNESELDAESPESLRSFAPTKGDVFNLIATHPMMHAGQFVIVRRQLDKPIVM